ncbi:MAG: hypothetical protein ACPGVC_07010 [Salibacteraceae bacterium]
MNLSKLILGIFVIYFNMSIGMAQTNRDSLISHYRNLSVKANSDRSKTMYSDSTRAEVIAFLNSKNSFEHPLLNIPYLGDLYSPDNAFRIITWNNSLKDGTYDYICFIQLAPNKNQETKWFELNDNHKSISRAESRSLKKDNWYGCLYYTIVPFKKDKQSHYALLGWEGNNDFSNKKLIECLYFNKKNEPLFGKTVFKTNRLNKRRVVFEYSKEAYLMLRYNEDLKQIIFNRLEPTKPELKGLYSFYQPTMTFDAYQVKKGEWQFIEDVNPRNKKNNKEFHDPNDLKKAKNKKK